MSLPSYINTGFKETLLPNPNKTIKLTPKLTPEKSKKICKSILFTGNKIQDEKRYIIPSQFPILTKSNNKKGGKRNRSRNNKKTLKKRFKKY
jgi:hypothetical protein